MAEATVMTQERMQIYLRTIRQKAEHLRRMLGADASVTGEA
jgi:hypothetical protein